MSTGMTVAQKKQAQMRHNLRELLKRGANEYEDALKGTVLNHDRMIRVALTACSVQPKLLECNQESVALSLLSAAQAGLEPDGYHGHLVPYKQTCQFVPDYKGLIQLALQNGVVIDAYAVYENDTFEYALGTNPHITHVPHEGRQRGKLRCAYAVATFPNGRTKFVVATEGDIDKRRKASASSSHKDSPWSMWYDEMAQKTAVKMLMKFVPRNPRMTAAVMQSDMADMGVQQRPITVNAGNAQPRESTSGKLLERMIEDNPEPQQMVSDLPAFDLQEFVGKTVKCQATDALDALWEQEVISRGETIEPDVYELAYSAVEQRRGALESAGSGPA